MRWASLTVLGILLAPGAASAEPFSLTPPTDGQWGRLILAVVDHNRAWATHDSYCPPSQGPDDWCPGWPLYQGSVEIVRYLSPTPEGWRHPGRFPQVRFFEGQALRWIDPGLRVDLLEQMPEGYLWMVWTASAEDDLVCLPPEVIERFQIRTRIRYRSRAERENCFRLSDVD